MKTLCEEIGERSVGSHGNRMATDFFQEELSSLGWKTSLSEFDAMDWKEEGARLSAGDKKFNVIPSPYSNACDVTAPLVSAGNLEELQKLEAGGKIILLHGDLAREQLMPKNFVFYNPEHHRKTVALLESSGASALICATGKNPELAGGVYPFPLIEDGDFDVPSVYMTEEEGNDLLTHSGREVTLVSKTERIPAKGYNVAGSTGRSGAERIVLTAHIDAKKGTPGAIDNATGVTVLLLIADLLKDYGGGRQIDIVAFNGEDYYSAPGQMTYIAENQGQFENILLNINIDGVGYKDGKSAFSLFNLPGELKKAAVEIIERSPGLVEGVPWPQGDHSIFLQFGRPAIAVTSQWIIDHNSTQDITHTPKDNLGIVDPGKLVETAVAIRSFIQAI
jgi:aminopeptidase YwaD